MQYQSLVYSNASNSNEQHDMEINSARVAVEEDVAKNSKDLFEQFDVTRNKTQNFRIEILISALSLTHSALNLLILTSHREWFILCNSRQQKNVLGSSRKLGQTGQSSNSNDVKVGNKKHAPMKKQTPVSIQPQDTMNFGCLRRTVLDERLKCNEYSTAALTGTLLHQIFQAGLTEDNPSIDFLEGYTEVVLLRNIESLYACGVNESDVRKTLIDAVPRILSWILRFTNKEENEDPNVCFGFHNRPNKVTISEASSNLTDSFYPLVWILEELNKSPGERENIEWILEELNNFNSVWP
ncbi:hypothetical protein Ahy_B01g054927 [Arachis hypogaea]|uniref:DNA replication factor Dna2 N-terminal domain-containing protein n=1 Tax=Arachis hypogaea TaxID=3818 RepID=A0A445AUL3_ARAHY|nr:hypothetical protein Ahy_B01g054927 [Arachis hypogaea]